MAAIRNGALIAPGGRGSNFHESSGSIDATTTESGRQMAVSALPRGRSHAPEEYARSFLERRLVSLRRVRPLVHEATNRSVTSCDAAPLASPPIRRRLRPASHARDAVSPCCTAAPFLAVCSPRNAGTNTTALRADHSNTGIGPDDCDRLNRMVSPGNTTATPHRIARYLQDVDNLLFLQEWIVLWRSRMHQPVSWRARLLPNVSLRETATA